MTYNSSRPIEECPLTKDSTYKNRLSSCCGDGLKFIVTCFTVLTIAITITLILQLLYTENALQISTGAHGAVASDYTNCSQIGTKILRKGGNAVDAAIAATICMTVVAPHNTGLGGGGYIMIYNHKQESVPLVIDFTTNSEDGVFAGNHIRIPGVIRGLEFAHKTNGKLPWIEVVKPSITLAEQGFVVSKELASEVAKTAEYEAFFGHLNAGDVLKLPKLAETLSIISQKGSDALYNGSISHSILRDKVNITEQLNELANYTVESYMANKTEFHGHVVYYPPHDGTFLSMIHALENLNISDKNSSSIEIQVLVARTLIKFGSATRTISPLSQRYSAVIAMDWEDTYVSIVTGMSSPLGLGYMTNAGFLLDKIDNPTVHSTFLPVIFHKKNAQCGLRGTFGTDNVFLTGQLLYNLIIRELNVSTAIEYPRYFLLPDGLAIENDKEHPIDALLLRQLSSIILTSHTDANLILKSVNAILKRKDSMMSHSDSRGGGLSSRF